MFIYLVLVIISLFFYFKLFKKPVKRISSDTNKYILITGCDSGFGRATAIQLDSLGFSVFATCITDDGEKSLRNSCSENLDVIRLDVTDSSQIEAAYEHVKKSMTSDTGLWSVINNAGIVVSGPLDWQSLDEIKKMADVNLWGLIDVTKTFLPLLKKSNGRLINVSSAGGRISLPYIGAYCTSKFAVEAFTDALRIELCRWRMKIILIEPGFFKTNMTAKKTLSSHWERLWCSLSDEKKLEYGEDFLHKSRDNLLTGVVDTCASPNTEIVSGAIVDAVMSLNPKIRYVIGRDANWLWIWIARLPTSMGDAVLRFISKIEVPAQCRQ